MQQHTEQLTVPKRQRKGLFGPIEFNFTSPFTPEECVYNLQSSANVEIIQENSDTYAFKISLSKEEDFYAIGQLRLYQETSTLFIGTAKLRCKIDEHGVINLIWLVILLSLAIYSPLIFGPVLALSLILAPYLILAAQHDLIDQIENAVAVKRNLPEKRLKKKKRRD